MTSLCSSLNSSHNESTSSFNKTKFPFSVFTKAYSKSGCTEIPKLAGIVQGVVVQITNESSLVKTPFPSLT